MHIKTGIDIVYIPRIEKIIENKKIINRIFNKSELKQINAEHLAGIFALKEAFFKALNMKPKWLAIEITNKSSGEPKINISKELNLNPLDISYSISHENEYAIANITILKK